jgi:thioredoxin-like negative regulator of GroEL
MSVTSLSLAASLGVSMLAPGAETYATYADAYRLTRETGRPMVVLVGAEWCGACQTMKQEVIPQVRRRGLLGKVAFAMVNLDRERALGTKLTRGGPIPQLLMFRRTSDGWRLSRLTGRQSVGDVEAFIDRGLRRDAAAQTASTAQEEPTPRTATATQAASAPGSAAKS